MRASACLAAVLALTGCPHRAYQAATRSLDIPPPPMDHGLDAQVLPSGLRLAVFQLPGLRDATLSLALGGGAADEPEGKAGLARVALRSAMLAPRARGGASLLEQLYAAGTLLGTQVNRDETTITVRFRVAFQDQVVAAVSDLLADPDGGIEDEAVQLAREEVATALEREASAAAAPLGEVERLALAGTAFGRLAPSPQGVRALTMSDVREFLRTSFAPARAILWVSTGQAAEKVAPRIVSALRGRAAGEAARPIPPEPGYSGVPPPERIGGPRQVELTGGSRPRLVLAWRATGLRFQPAAAMAGAALREHLGRRAARADLTGKVSHVAVSTTILDRAGVLLIEVGLERIEDAPAVRQALIAAAPAASLFWTLHVATAAPYWRRELRLDRERELALGWVGPVGRLVRAVGSADVPTWLDLNEQSQIGQAVSAWLDAWVAPGPAVVATIAATPDSVAAAGADPAAAADKPSARAGDARTWLTARSLVAAAVPGDEQLARLLEPAGLEAARRERLPNGLELLVLRRPGAPFAFLTLFLPGGVARLSEGLAAQRALAAARAGLRAEGCDQAPAAEIYTDGVLMKLSGPASWLPLVIEATACWGRSLSAPRRAPSPDDAAPWLVYEALLTGGPLPVPSGGEGWSSAFLGRLPRPDGAVVALAGDVDPESALQQLRAAFGRFAPRGPALAAPPDPAWPRARRVIVQDVPGAKQAWATLLLRLPDRLPSVSARRAVLATLLTDRAERTFEPSGLEVEHQSAGIGQASFEGIEVSGPVALVPAALAETLRELARLRDRGPSRVDADSARWNAARQVAYGHDSLPGATLGLLGLASSGLPLDTWNGFAAELRQVDAAAVRDLVRASAVGAEGLLLRGDAATLVPLLTREGLTPEVLAPPDRRAPGTAR